jgi:hypothetical protein
MLPFFPGKKLSWSIILACGIGLFGQSARAGEGGWAAGGASIALRQQTFEGELRKGKGREEAWDAERALEASPAVTSGAATFEEELRKGKAREEAWDTERALRATPSATPGADVFEAELRKGKGREEAWDAERAFLDAATSGDLRARAMNSR